MKILNLYAGIGGNRKLWSDEHQITAVENNDKIANIYKKYFPNDTVVVSDAHQYLLDNYQDFDFIWSSPPCQTHSRTNYFTNEIRKEKKYPDMSLYQEIIYLTQFFKGKFCVENVVSYYEPLIKPQQVGRHYLWSNFNIPKIKMPKIDIGKMCGKNQTANKTPLEERNAVNSELGLHILNCANDIYKENQYIQKGLFK
jgi:DNA (cytosine-5)-methyltransferase 1|tara:strand:+ start:80 stop:673 length:594 start_codon:yes stop_codon:yes gene_type:complete